MLVGLFLNHCFHHRQIPGASIFLNLPFPGCVDPGVARTRRSLPLLRRNPLCYPLQYYGACKTKGKIWKYPACMASVYLAETDEHSRIIEIVTEEILPKCNCKER